MKATIGFYLDTRREKKDKKYPVKLRITHNRKNRFYGTGIDLTEKEFEAVKRGTRMGDLESVRNDIDDMVNKARIIIDNLPAFSFNQFKAKYTGVETSGNGDVFDALESYRKKLETQGRIGSADSYKCTINSLKRFHGRTRNLQFVDVTPEFLLKYHNWMKVRGYYREKGNGEVTERGATETTIGIYLRNLRRVFNIAVRKGEVNPELLPFGDPDFDLYRIPTGTNPKKALSIDEVALIMEYDAPEGSSEEYYRDMWVFSYLGAGINTKDIAKLKHSNIKNDSIYYERSKTARSKKNKEMLEIPLIPENRRIIEKWGTDPEKGGYIFPVLSDDLTLREQKAKIQQFNKMINKYIRRVALKVGLDDDISTYTARHSYASVLKDANVGIAHIKESLGHSSYSVTEKYLKSLQGKDKAEISKKLIKSSKIGKIANN